MYLHKDNPNVFYAPHAHEKETAHIIIEGEMIITIGEETKVVKPGDRFDVVAGEVHAAKMGSQGCVYLIGER